ncbi:MAG: TVP38/TMEM64 family protein, partial [Nitrospinota bacterium]
MALLFLCLLWLAAYGGWFEGVPFLRLLAKGDIQGLRAYLLSFGAWAPVVSALLMILQSLIAPLPAFVVTIANGMLFGLFWGALLSWSSAMVAAALCFYLSRLLGRPLVERWVGETQLATFDRLVSRWGRWAVLVARLVPTVSFD